LAAILALLTACSPKNVGGETTAVASSTPPVVVATGLQTFQGFITSEDDFVDPVIGADPSKDTRAMILMNAMAQSGLGMAAQEAGVWKFYYFSGKFATTIFPAFNGTGAQLDAWKIVENTQKKDHISVIVTGSLEGKTATNTGGDADGVYWPVITVSSIVES
jgi:hypothetical protein